MRLDTRKSTRFGLGMPSTTGFGRPLRVSRRFSVAQASYRPDAGRETAGNLANVKLNRNSERMGRTNVFR
jgi:hypothetical protein